MPRSSAIALLVLIGLVRPQAARAQQSCPAPAIEQAKKSPSDYSAHPKAPYTALEVRVPTGAGHVLAGTLTLPRNATPNRRVPVVVTISGSGCQNRDEDLGAIGMLWYRPFRQFADSLGHRGIAVLRLDDRGYGASGGDHNSATTADFAEDVRAALGWLRTRPEIDPGQLALLGHSEGAIIAPLAALREPSLKAMVLMASSAQPGRQILQYQLRNMVGFDTTVTGPARDAALARIPVMIDSMKAASAWMAYFLDYDPLVTARQVKVPVLILTGGTDRQATSDQAEILGGAFREGGNGDVTVKVFPDLNHLFIYDPDGTPWNYPKLTRSSVQPEVIGTVVEWLVQRLR